MTRFAQRLVCAAALLAASSATGASADPVIPTHPRLLFDSAGKPRLLAKVTASDASWLALKARADVLATYAIYPYEYATSSDSPPGTIYYTYQGEGWLAATLPLGFAYQMTGDTTYSDKLIELAQEMIRAQSDPQNNPPIGYPPIELDSYYASRTVASTIAFIFDYCYDQLSPALKAQMLALMNDYFDDVRINGYQAQDYSNAADGNYFGGHLYGVALMGYASYGDNPRAQEMIDWARIRFDGTPGAVPPESVPFSWRTQCFDGGLFPAVALDYNGPAITGNPFKDGFDFQGWSYGSEEHSRMIDYMLTVQSATGEDLLTPHAAWFPKILRAERHALFPNRFMIDPTGDWGAYQGAVISAGLPKRLAFLLAGTPDGPGAQYLAESEIAAPTIPGVEIYPVEEWVEFFFADPTRPSAPLALPPYYTGFAPNCPQGATSPGGTNGAMPYFTMRSDWGPDATWASVQMGSQWWDDHQHYAAGHMVLARGSDYLLVSAGDWKTATDTNGDPTHGGPGILGDSLEARESSLSNTLYFDDFGDFQSTEELASGGQLAVGIDQVVADELSQDFGYVRSDLSSAYNRAGDPDDTPNRKLDHFYRSFLYLRAPNVFVVFDQVAAKTSTNPNGPYKKHIRWHLPDLPVINGKTARLDQGQSRLFLDVVLPQNATLNVVDELMNPDPCDGSDPGCVPFGQANAGTYRVEVRDPVNPLSIPFLTVLQPGPPGSAAPADTPLTSLDGKMTGVDVSQTGGVRNIVFFNSQPGQVPPPVTSTSYTFPSPDPSVTHTLLGVVPSTLYSVGFSGGVVYVSQSPSGDKMSSPSGVLEFSGVVSTPFASVSASKSVTGHFHEGGTVSYAIRLTNSGPAPAQNTAADELQDTVPASLTVTGADDGGDPGTVTVVGNDVRWNGSLQPGASVTVTIQASIHPGTAGSVISNQGTIDYDSDGDGTADTTAPTDDPALPGATDPTSFTVTVPVASDLVPGSARVLDLAAPPGPPAVSLFGLRQGAHSSYEVVVDATTGDLANGGAGPSLELVAGDGVTPLQASTPAGAGPSRSLRLENASAAPVLDQIVRVTSAGCAGGCTPEDQYRIRAWDTTLSLPRFNSSATQTTLVVLQNTTAAAITGHMWLWDATGAAAGNAAFTLAPRASFVLNTASLAPGKSGTATVSHNAPYGALTGKGVAVEPSTGFTFDTPLEPRPR